MDAFFRGWNSICWSPRLRLFCAVANVVSNNVGSSSRVMTNKSSGLIQFILSSLNFVRSPTSGLSYDTGIVCSINGVDKFRVDDTSIDFSISSGTFKTPIDFNVLKYNGNNNIISTNTTLSTTGTQYSFIPLNSDNNFMITLPTTTANNGLEYLFLNIGNGIVNIATYNTSQYFNGNSTITNIQMNKNDRLHIICYNNNWFTI